jgi:putative phosphoribosyl transferase
MATTVPTPHQRPYHDRDSNHPVPKDDAPVQVEKDEYDAFCTGMTTFRDRTDAGKKLSLALEHYAGQKVLVLAIPRGGVEVGYQVARHLGSDLSIVISRKLPFPDNPEAGFGAVAEDGSTYINKAAAGWLPRPVIRNIIREQEKEIRRRIATLRHGQPLPVIIERTIILIDDGIAMGSTMRAAINLCRNQKAGHIVVAAPVAGARTAQEIGALADEAVILTTPPLFQAVAQVYENWYDVPDDEVIDILDRWRQRG